MNETNFSTKETHIFISYSRQDKRFVNKLIASLRDSSVPIWIDHLEIKAGDSIQGRIEQAIINASYVLVIVSPASTNSSWVTEELRLAMARQRDEQKKLVIPILYRECQLPAFLRDRHYVDFRNPRKYNISFQSLLGAIDTLYFNSPHLSTQPVDDAPILLNEILEVIKTVEQDEDSQEEHDWQDIFKHMPQRIILSKAIELNSFGGQARQQALLGLAMMSHGNYGQPFNGYIILVGFVSDISRRKGISSDFYTFISEIVESPSIEVGYRETALRSLLDILDTVDSRRMHFNLLPDIFPSIGFDELADKIIRDLIGQDFNERESLGVLWKKCDSPLYRDEIIQYLSRSIKWNRTPKLPDHVSSLTDPQKLWQIFHKDWQKLHSQNQNSVYRLNHIVIDDPNFSLSLLFDNLEASLRLGMPIDETDYMNMLSSLSAENIDHYKDMFGNSETFNFLCSIVASPFTDIIFSMLAMTSLAFTYGIEALEYDWRFPSCLVIKKQSSFDANVPKYESLSVVEILVDAADSNDADLIILLKLLDTFPYVQLRAVAGMRIEDSSKKSKRMKQIRRFLEGKVSANSVIKSLIESSSQNL